MCFKEEYYSKYERDINYEFDMFYKTGKYLLDLLRNNNNDKVVLRETQDKVYLESFLLHYRNLYDFFSDKKAVKDDVIASEIFNEWNKIYNLHLSKYFQEINKIILKDSNGKRTNRINKLLLHITEDRQNELKYFEWNIQPLFENMNSIIIEFKSTIPNGATSENEASTPKKLITVVRTENLKVGNGNNESSPAIALMTIDS